VCLERAWDAGMKFIKGRCGSDVADVVSMVADHV